MSLIAGGPLSFQNHHPSACALWDIVFTVLCSIGAVDWYKASVQCLAASGVFGS